MGMTEYFNEDRETQIDYWMDQRAFAATALRVANERLAELGVVEPLHEVEQNEDQLRLDDLVA